MQIFFKEEAAKLAKKWLKEFCGYHGAVSKNELMWGMLDFKNYTILSDNDAIKQYQTQKALSYIVLFDNLETAYETEIRPEKCGFPDYYVFPPDFAWTFVSTHENGWLGPYFVFHKDYDKMMKKLEEIEYAKQNGWM